jgi:imidazolonepropionase-like amidohydrolase
MGVSVFRCGLLIDGTGRDPMPNAVLVVQDGVITWVGPQPGPKPPSDASVFDLADLTVLPGLIDCHVHLGGTDSSEPLDWVIEDNLQGAACLRRRRRFGDGSDRGGDEDRCRDSAHRRSHRDP